MMVRERLARSEMGARDERGAEQGRDRFRCRHSVIQPRTFTFTPDLGPRILHLGSWRDLLEVASR
jgi:hypothetical protein